MELTRCEWCKGHQIYEEYHDKEWGVPVRDDRKQFEFLILESAQAGLSWLTVLKKRENYRKAFAGFDPEVVAKYGPAEVENLLLNPGIIRNRQKIISAIHNAHCFLRVQQEFGSFSNYLWRFVDGKPVINHWSSIREIPATTPLSDTISKDLMQRGFRFVGSTIVYAHLQATGLVMDHITSCHRYPILAGNESDIPEGIPA